MTIIGTHHDRLLFEYNDERAGDFALLLFVPSAKTAVLGLITTKRSQLEPVDDLRHRIDEAAGYRPLEQLALSPQCGFASVIVGIELTEGEQVAEARPHDRGRRARVRRALVTGTASACGVASCART